METLPVEQRLQELDRCQESWYLLAACWCSGRSVLDVGAGTGYGLEILQRAGAGPVCGIDPLPLRPHILPLPIGMAQSASYDVVVAMDVIEHVEDDVAFLENMLRVARREVFFSTPNWLVSHAGNAYHAREYTPEELLELIAGRGWTERDRVAESCVYTLGADGRPGRIASPSLARGAFGVRLIK